MANISLIIDILFYVSAFGIMETLTIHLGISTIYQKYIFYFFIGVIGLILNENLIQNKDKKSI